jgi:mono/diheme cytochrome c family protein
MRRILFGLTFVLTPLLAPMARADEPAALSTLDFVREIRPIFEASCYSCHGGEKQKSGLRLDRKADALAGGDLGTVIEPGDAESSRLIEYVEGRDPDHLMPPKGERLTTEQVAKLRQWIDAGAIWPDDTSPDTRPASTHWAFKTPVRPPLPLVKNADWVRNPIDAFILRKLEAEGVEPSSEASRTTLLRRLNFDIHGLPPTPEEIDEFISDDRPDAYERLVDRLLASPQYGERWGRHWLDLARYADSDGYEKDNPRPNAWRFRDWVINALNSDMPFDQFTIEQLAGDLLPNPTETQRIATGFHRNTLTNTEGGVDREEFRVAAVIDRVNTTGTVWLGLTVACAQCHTHKYDPILHKEYYSLFAFFNSGQEVDLAAPLPGETEAYVKAMSAYDAAHKPYADALAKDDREARPERQRAWEASLSADAPGWVPLTPISAKADSGATLTILPDHSILASGTAPDTDTYAIVVRADLPSLKGLKVEALDDASLPSKGPGRTPHGNFVLSEFAATVSDPAHPDSTSPPIPFGRALEDFAQGTFPASAALDGRPETGWAIAPQMGKPHQAIFECKDRFDLPAGSLLTIKLEQKYGSGHTIGKLRISGSASQNALTIDGVSPEIVEIARIPEANRDAAQSKKIADAHRAIDPIYQKLLQEERDHAKGEPKPPESKAMVLVENSNPPKTHIHIRGDFQRPGDEVQPDVPAVLPPLQTSGATPTRLDFARWLVAPENPLTARVTVNRIWRNLFGRALTPTVDDFGTRGEVPSHPELLDWLATEFPRQGWSQKSLIKLIVMSSTYRQSSKSRPELHDRDPLNTWLARQNRVRFEAEIIRDAALATSGLLEPEIGGPSVHPPQPPGISDLTYAGSARWVESQGRDRYRRGMYTFFQRTSPYPMLMTFDAPDANLCTAKRERSNTPLQALTLLNDRVFVETAQALGNRLLEGEGCPCPDCRGAEAFRISLGREPTAEESEALTALYESLLVEAQSLRSADKAAASGETHPRDPIQETVWFAIARTLMNLDEFVTRE